MVDTQVVFLLVECFLLGPSQRFDDDNFYHDTLTVELYQQLDRDGYIDHYFARRCLPIGNSIP